MATQTKTKSASETQFEEATERIRALNERVLESGKKAGQVYLDAYEKTLQGVADFQERVGGSTQIEWIANLAEAQANFTREIGKAYASAARELVK